MVTGCDSAERITVFDDVNALFVFKLCNGLFRAFHVFRSFGCTLFPFRRAGDDDFSADMEFLRIQLRVCRGDIVHFNAVESGDGPEGFAFFDDVNGGFRRSLAFLRLSFGGFFRRKRFLRRGLADRRLNNNYGFHRILSGKNNRFIDRSCRSVFASFYRDRIDCCGWDIRSRRHRIVVNGFASGCENHSACQQQSGKTAEKQLAVHVCKTSIMVFFVFAYSNSLAHKTVKSNGFAKNP